MQLPMKEKKMTINEPNTTEISSAAKAGEEKENRRLRELLQKAVGEEPAPAALREKIRRLIRE